MDGVFVPNISFGFPVIEQIKKHARKPLDVHLMIVDPDRYFERFRAVGADILSVHLEACIHLHRSVQVIKNLGMKAGVVINPHTPVASLQDIITEVDLVLVMSVNPGYGGQSFIGNTYKKIAELREMIDISGREVLIEVDGGVGPGNARQLFDAGVDVLVAGNTVFSAENPAAMISMLKNI
jgi:ribulose-phosphate 3-epimerase